jgi:hypothetical protein
VDDNEIAKWANLYARSDPKTAVAVALAESGGNPNKTNRNSDGSTDSGLWQINSVHQRSHPSWTVEALKDPRLNAEAMSVVSSGGSNWQPWTAYKNGNYKQYLGRAGSAVDATSGNALGGTIEGAGNLVEDLNPLEAIKDLVGVLGGFVSWLTDPDTWRRIALVGIGIGIVYVGTITVARGTDAGQSVERVATGVARGISAKG